MVFTPPLPPRAMTISASPASLSRIQALQRCMRFEEGRGRAKMGAVVMALIMGRRLTFFSFGQGVGWFGWVVGV